MHSPPCRRLAVLAFADAFLRRRCGSERHRTRSDRPGRHRCAAARFHAPQAARRRRRAASSRGRWISARRVRRGVERRSRSQGPRFRRSIRALRRSAAQRPRLRAGRRRAHLACSGIGAGRDGLRSWRAARMGGLGRRRCSARKARLVSARVHRAHARVRLPQPALRPFRPGLRSLAHQLRFRIRAGHRASIASSSTAPPTWSSPTAARSPASMATARRAPRCCRRCSGLS